MSVALEVRGLWKCYAAGVRGCSARVWVLQGVTLALARGERVGLIGARGAGTTTLLHCLRGLRRPDAGVIDVAASARSELVLLDRGESAVDGEASRSSTLLIAARDPEVLDGMVDRCLLLRDGQVLPLPPPTRARCVAEGSVARC
jgi:alpha-D-ribose 1-methylphosphonate 5-triphosphate synthase subunit PhnL